MARLFKPSGILSLLLLFAGTVAFAQTRTVTGTVSEKTETGSVPVIGAVVMLKGSTSNATVTNRTGNYSIRIPESGNAVLVFSAIGYVEQEIEVGGRSKVDAVLELSSEMLEDVVVVGYGVQKRSDVAGSVTSVKAEDLASYPATGVAEMLRGRAAGVQITTSSGAPGSNSSIQVRGKRSLLDGSNTPMFVIDGIVATETEFNSVSPDEVESLEILKDAASQAIYGARAANGVIIITTKRGTKEKATITFNSTVSLQKLWRNFDFYSAKEYYELRREAIAHDNGYGYEPADYADELATLTPAAVLTDSIMERMYNDGKSTDWEDLMFSTAVMQKYNLGIRGGTEKMKISLSAGWMDHKGMVTVGSHYKRANLRLNTDYKVKKWLDVGISTSFIKNNNVGAPSSFNSYIIKSPLSTPYEEDGKTYSQYTNATGEQNPLYNAQYYKKQTDTDIARLNGYIDIHPIKGFSYRLNAGYYNRYQEVGEYKKAQYTGGGAAGSIKGSKLNHYTLENIFNYAVPFKNKDFTLNLTAVQSFEHNISSDLGFGANNVPVDSFWWNMIADGENSSMTRSLSEYYLLSYLARAQFGYKGRYLMNVAVRRDGSSRFGKNHKWGNFPSVSAAWRISQEPWMKQIHQVSNLKLRASYGLVGNQNGIGNYTTLGTVSDREYEFGSNYVMGYLPSEALPNPNLRWESTASANFAVDFGLFKNRLNGTIEYYATTTSDLLFKRSINSVLGYTSMTDNVAKTKTHGIDLNIDGAIIRKKDIEWTAGLTWSLSKNKIVRLSGEVDESGVPVDDVTNGWFIGQPINVIYNYKPEGIYQYSDFAGYDANGKWILKPTIDTDGDGTPDAAIQRDDKIEPGKIKIADTNGDGRINADDRVIYNADPDFIASFNMGVRFWDFEFFMDWYSVVGGYKTNAYLYDSNSGGSLQGKNNGIKVNYWTPLNPSNEFPRPSLNSATTYQSCLSITDASYLRLRTLSLAYHVPKKLLGRIGVQSAKFTVSATNLLTFTKYLSYSPETTPGTYPEARQFAASLNLTF